MAALTALWQNAASAKRSWRLYTKRPKHDMGFFWGFLFRVAISVLAVFFSTFVVFFFGLATGFDFGVGFIVLIGAMVGVMILVGEHYRHRLFSQISSSRSKFVKIEITGDAILVDGKPTTLASPSAKRSVGGVAKRVFDVVCACFALLALAPLLAIVSFLIALNRKGVFIRLQRYTITGEEIAVLKFRTGEMRYASDGTLLGMAATPMGGFLRRTSIDELPQLFNVLRGEMSIVGPRPYVEPISVPEDIVKGLPGTRPGITGLAVTLGFRGQMDKNRLAQAQQLDFAYVRRWSFATDMRIIWRTLVAEFISGSAYL